MNCNVDPMHSGEVMSTSSLSSVSMQLLTFVSIIMSHEHTFWKQNLYSFAFRTLSKERIAFLFKADLLVIKVCFKSFVTYIIKLLNFFNICSRGIIRSVVERFWAGQLQYNQKAQKIVKFQRCQGRRKIKGFSRRDPTWSKMLYLKTQLFLFYNKRNF